MRLWKKRAFEMLLKMREVDPEGGGLSFLDLRRKVTGGSRAVVMGALRYLEDLGLVEMRLDEDKHRRWAVTPQDPEDDEPLAVVDPLPDLGLDAGPDLLAELIGSE
jgi:DNA-binding transcriptional ArsR family regulator